LRDPRLIEFAKQMRREMTTAEKRLWTKIRANRFLGVKFRAQKVIGRYIADFSSREPMLVIELDGSSHADSEIYDAVRTDFLNKQGYRVVRFLNSEVFENLTAVLDALAWHIETPPLPGAARLSLSPEGERASI
jgi:very-short-patch-repair endonuclease